jgi:serine-type D-Ala-D-Ala carboxypeptidase (penicillin-binding protein 5/6)
VIRRRGRGLAVALGLLAWLLVPGSAAAELVPPPPPVIAGETPPAGWPEPPEVAAPAFLLLDAGTGQVLASRAADERRPVASTIKILTALTASTRGDLDDEVVVGDEVEGVIGASVSLSPGDRWTLEQLLQAILVRSGNDAAETIAVAIGGDQDGFVALMEEDAAALGLPVGAPDGVVITSPTGLDDAQRLSAADLGILARALLADPELRAIVAAPAATLPGVGSDENRNLLVGSYPGATGVKTGFTEASGNSVVASASRDGHHLIAVVLGAGPDPERFRDAAALLDHGFDAFDVVSVEEEVTLLVAGGRRVLAAGPVTVTAPAGAAVTLPLPLPARAPEGGALPVPLLVDDRELAEVRATVDADQLPAVAAGATLGRAAVDGVYAALRAAHDGDRLP